MGEAGDAPCPYDDLNKADSCHPFYQDALTYWEKIPPTVNGMLGGFDYISHIDVGGSKRYLRILMNSHKVGKSRALDCGAGIGRVTKNVLLPLFDTVDMLEVNKKFLDEAPNYIGAVKERVGEYYCTGMHEFVPTHKYDVVWCQWVIGHLTDKHLTEFFMRCKESLNENGVICIKDNVSSGERVFDKDDSSLLRTVNEIRSIIADAGLTIIREEMQQGFPGEIYAVPIIAFR